MKINLTIIVKSPNIAGSKKSIRRDVITCFFLIVPITQKQTWKANLYQTLLGNANLQTKTYMPTCVTSFCNHPQLHYVPFSQVLFFLNDSPQKSYENASKQFNPECERLELIGEEKGNSVYTFPCCKWQCSSLYKLTTRCNKTELWGNGVHYLCATLMKRNELTSPPGKIFPADPGLRSLYKFEVITAAENLFILGNYKKS